MNFHELAQYLRKLDSTTKRLEITQILVELLQKLSGDEVKIASYLILGKLDAEFRNKTFNIADKMMVRAIASAENTDAKEIEARYQIQGDLGDVLEAIHKDTNNKNITIIDMHMQLLRVAETEGTGSQEKKIALLTNILQELDALSAKYLVRIVLGTTRLGFTELTIIDALAWCVTQKNTTLDKKIVQTQIESKYNAHPDIGLIAQNVVVNGLKGLEAIKLTPGVPVLPQKPQRVAAFAEVLERMPVCIAEYKFDGTRVQLHIDRNIQLNMGHAGLFPKLQDDFLIKTFTRNLEETTHQYPDIVTAAKGYINATSAIIDGEAIGYDPHTGEFLPFQQIMQRKRKHAVTEAVEQIPLRYFVFDILYLNGKDLTTLSLAERKKLLKEVVKTGPTIIYDKEKVINNLNDLTAYFEDAKSKGLEGLIVKNQEASYQAGARSYNWIKLKIADAKLLDDSVDCVVLGYYSGKGARSKFGIGGFLAAVFDKNTQTFKTVTKVGTGLTDADWKKLKEMCDKVKVQEKPRNVDSNKVYDTTVWVKPVIVVELGADEVTKSTTHTAGYALRFPRLIKFREDKSALDATTIEEIEAMFANQRRGRY